MVKDKAEKAPPGRKPYRKPELRSSVLFERRSLACGLQPFDKDIDPTCGTFHQSV
jgi:hypothetical protein